MNAIDENPSVASEKAVVTPSVVRAKAALEAALERPVAMWSRGSAGDWRAAESASFEASHIPADLNDEQRLWLTALLEQASASANACRAPLNDQTEAIAAPVVERAGNVGAVGVFAAKASEAAHLEKIARLAVKDIQQTEELEWLRDENYVFSQQVTDDFEELTFLRSMATHLVVKDATLHIGHLVEKTISGLREMIGAEAIYFVERTDDGLSIVQGCCANEDPAKNAARSAVERMAEANYLRAEDNPCVRNDLHESDPEAHAAGIRQFLMVTISTSARNFGWFIAVNRCNAGRMWKPSPLLQIGHDEFGTWEASLLSAAATLVASHASNLDLIREKEQLLISTVRSLVSALDSKDAYTRGHSERVALFSKRISENLGYDEASAERLYLAGLLHDVGKIGVSDAVLRKPDRLTDEEYEEIKRHPDEGWAILRDLEQMQYVLPGVLHHHEQVDGSGYPDGLTKNEIPLDARIMAVADAYDAMTSDRAYRAGMPHEKAIGIITAGAGTQWDADCVIAFLEAMDDITTIRYGYKPYERPARSGPALKPHCKS